MSRTSILRSQALLLLLLLAATACGTSRPAASPTAAPYDAGGAFPPAEAIPGWSISQEKQSYDRSNLYNLVDGQAESFFAYGFEGATVQRYQNADGVLLNLEIWQMKTEADAYGLFSAGRAGEPVEIGNEGDADVGRRLAFWQSRFFASLNASQPVPDETLWSFARFVSAALPTGGERPAILGRLPQDGLVPLSAVFFHEEMSIQMEIWLGGENILGLSQETDAVAARYQSGAAGETARLMLVEYPAAGQAAQALKAMQGGSLTDLLASDASGKILGAVFGKGDAQWAQDLLAEALK